MSRRIHTFTLPTFRSPRRSHAAADARFRRITTLLVGALVAIAAVAAVSALASGSTSTFETGTDPFTSLECAHPSTQFTRVTSPVREGTYAARFSETATDVWSNGSVRCLAAKYDSGETTGNDYYYHLSFYFPQTLSDNLLWELHHPSTLYNISAGCSVAPHALLARSGGNIVYRLFTGNCNGTIYAHQEVISIPGLNPYPKNVWVDFLVHIKFAESNTGVVEVYWRKDGDPWPSTPQVSRSGVPTMPYSDALNVHNVKLYWEMGLYPGSSGYSGSDAVIIDDYRRETSLAAAEGGTSGTTPPPPTTVAPASTAPPQVSGTAQVGQTLTTTTGTWSGSPTSYAYQWQTSVDGGSNWADVAGATGASFVEGSSVQGDLARVVVTASNSAGSATATSASLGPIAASSSSITLVAPASTSLPQISGTTQVGQNLTTTSGSWSGSPTSYGYQWQYSRDSGATWLNVNGATSTTFQETSTFQDAKIRVRTTASNSAGSTTVGSSAVGPVAASSSTSTTAFTVTTNLTDGQVWKRKRRTTLSWTATPSIPVASVEFWVDGVRGWLDTSSPYAYVLDGNSFPAGSHTLTVKAIAADGRTASKTVSIWVG
jgi:hypothetical protein